MDLLKDSPLHSVHLSYLGAGKALAPHRGALQFQLRYHLGLVIPEGSNGSDDPYLIAFNDTTHARMMAEAGDYPSRNTRPWMCHDDQGCINEYIASQHAAGRGSATYHWRAGKDMVFDDMFEHAVVNGGDGARLILLADMNRQDCPFFMNSLAWAAANWWIPAYVDRAQNMIQYEAADTDKYLAAKGIDGEDYDTLDNGFSLDNGVKQKEDVEEL
jgi:hypothetical protein